jgi:hypothetical protein
MVTKHKAEHGPDTSGYVPCVYHNCQYALRVKGKATLLNVLQK